MSKNINLIVSMFLLLGFGLNVQSRESMAQENGNLEGTVLTSNGEPAGNASVFIVTDRDATNRPGLLLNNLPKLDPDSPNKLRNAPPRMFAVLADRAGQAISEESNEQAVDGVKLFKTNSEGKFKYSSSRSSFFIQSHDGTETAFVPPGARFPVRLRKCVKLKIDNSVLASNKDLGKASVTIVWKNCLAGSYPLLYLPNSVYESNPDLPPMDWRIYPYFEFVTYIDDIDLSLECDLELLLPPGEVSISVLTDKQRAEIEKFNPAISKSRRHFPATSGLVTISDANTVQVPLKIGACIKGKIVEQKNASSPLPDWAGGKRNYMMRFRETPSATVSYPHFRNDKKTFAQKYRQFQSSVPQIVRKLTSRSKGFNFRQQNQTGVIAVMFDREGNFISVPLPNGDYYGEVTSWNRGESDRSSSNERGFRKAIPAGHKVISLKLPSDDAIAGILGIGDFVDVIWTDSKTSKTDSSTILKQVRVFSISTRRAAVGVLVNTKQVEKISKCNDDLGGEFRLALTTSPEENSQTEVAFSDHRSGSGNVARCILKSPLLSASSEERQASLKLQQVAAKFSGGYLATLAVDGNAVFRTVPNEPFFQAGEFIAEPLDDAARSEEARDKGAKNDADKVEKEKDRLRSSGDLNGDEIATDLESVVARQFDKRMKQRQRELDELELSLEAARKKLSIRQLQRDEIIQKRVRKLLSQKEPTDKMSTAKAEIKTLKDVCIAYKLQVGQYPASLECLVKKPAELSLAEWGGPYLEKPMINDPWNAPYELQRIPIPGETEDDIAIVSRGPDGKSGTDDAIYATKLDR